VGVPNQEDAKSQAWFAWRLERATGLAGSCTVLPAVEARREDARAWAELQPLTEEVVDLRDVDHAAGSVALSQLPMPPNAEVVVTYADDPDHAVAMTWAVFTEFWDDVWHPSSDDVRVAGRDRGLIVEIDHEEQLKVISRYGRRGPRSPA